MRRMGRLAVAAMCMLAVACSDDDSGEDAAGGSSTSSTTIVVVSREGPVALGTFTLSGAVEASGPFEIIYSRDEEQMATCESIASPEAAAFIVPVPTVIGEQRLVWEAAVARFDGPGTYELDRLGTVLAAVRETPDAEPVRYRSGEGSTATVEVLEGNAGSFTFAGLRADTGAELSGRFDWTCTVR